MARIGNAGLTVDGNLAVGYATAAYPLDVNGSTRQVNGFTYLDNTSA